MNDTNVGNNKMPSPLKKSFAAEELERRKKKMGSRYKLYIGILVVIVGIGGYALYSRYITVKITTTVTEKRPSIAVLSFVDMSAEKDQEWYCDGMAETLINALAQVKDLRVIARNSAFAFKGEHRDIREIGRELDVETVLEGSIQKFEDNLRITVQLNKAADGSHIFSEIYDRKLEDIFAIQDEIAVLVVQELKGELLDSERELIKKHSTENSEAYNLYHMGRQLWDRRDKSMLRAIEYYQQAVELDPNYALPYAGMADAYNLSGFYGYMRPKDAFPEAKAAVEKALEIDENLAAAYASKAFINLFYDWDWDETEKNCKKALVLDPDYAYGHKMYSDFLGYKGMSEKSFAETERARKLDPFSIEMIGNLARKYLTAKKFDEAKELLDMGLELQPNSVFLHNYLSQYYYYTNNQEKDIAIRNKTYELSGSTNHKAILGRTYAYYGYFEEAKEILRTLLEQREKEYVSAYHISSIYYQLQDEKASLNWLEKAYEERDPGLIYLSKPDENSDLRYVAIWNKMRLGELRGE